MIIVVKMSVKDLFLSFFNFLCHSSVLAILNNLLHILTSEFGVLGTACLLVEICTLDSFSPFCIF